MKTKSEVNIIGTYHLNSPGNGVFNIELPFKTVIVNNQIFRKSDLSKRGGYFKAKPLNLFGNKVVSSVCPEDGENKYVLTFKNGEIVEILEQI